MRRTSESLSCIYVKGNTDLRCVEPFPHELGYEAFAFDVVVSVNLVTDKQRTYRLVDPTSRRNSSSRSLQRPPSRPLSTRYASNPARIQSGALIQIQVQLELRLHNPQLLLLSYLNSHGIVSQAYSPRDHPTPSCSWMSPRPHRTREVRVSDIRCAPRLST